MSVSKKECHCEEGAARRGNLPDFRTFSFGNPRLFVLFRRSPHQSADWFAMTCGILRCFDRLKGTSRRGCSFFGAADRIEGIKVLPPSRPAAGECPPGHPHLNRSSPIASECKKGTPPKGMFLFGAADRTRTGTELPPADFKSAVSTIPPQRRLPNYFSIVSGGSQGIHGAHIPGIDMRRIRCACCRSVFAVLQ